jgi:hypothetical protein
MRRLFYFYIIPKFCPNSETNKYKYFILIINKIIKIIRRSYIHTYIMSPCLLQHYIVVRNKKCNNHEKSEKGEKNIKNNSKRTSSTSVDLNMVDIMGIMWL